eukprot:990551-Pleurochrysis_carterae.AAC.1
MPRALRRRSAPEVEEPRKTPGVCGTVQGTGTVRDGARHRAVRDHARHCVVRVVDSARRLAERDSARRRGLRDVNSARRLVARDGARPRTLRGQSLMCFLITNLALQVSCPRVSVHLIGAVAASALR